MKILLIGSTGIIGNIVKESLNSHEIELYAPKSNELNLRDKNGIGQYLKISTFNGQKCFDYIIYCALDKDNVHFEEINIQNLKNLMFYQSYFHAWIHFSSRAIYDGLGAYKNIPVIAIESLPEPNSPYSRLKYNEERILQKELLVELYILRLFDVSNSKKYLDIIQRWREQVAKKGICKNEVLSPIETNIIQKVIGKILTTEISSGTYNLCGKQTISAKDIMGFHANGEQITKTGKMSFEIN